MSNLLFTDAQLDQIRAIVRDELAPAGETTEATAPELVYVPVTFHFRDGPAVYCRVAPAVREQIGQDWRDDDVTNGVYAHWRPIGANAGESGMLCICFDEVLFID